MGVLPEQHGSSEFTTTVREEELTALFECFIICFTGVFPSTSTVVRDLKFESNYNRKVAKRTLWLRRNPPVILTERCCSSNEIRTSWVCFWRATLASTRQSTSNSSVGNDLDNKGKAWS